MKSEHFFSIKEVEPNKDLGARKRFNELDYQMGLASQYLNAHYWGYDKEENQWLDKFDQQELNGLLDAISQFGKRLTPDISNAEAEKITKEYEKTYHHLLPLYAQVLRGALRKQRSKMNRLFSEATADKHIDPEISSDLKRTVINLEHQLPPEQAKTLRESFPSGNFLLHTASVNESILIIESGQILSSIEIAKKRGEAWGRGGRAGISFNMNDVRVLTGDEKHFIGFLADPELILDQNHKLALPKDAATYEVQLLPSSHKREPAGAPSTVPPDNCHLDR